MIKTNSIRALALSMFAALLASCGQQPAKPPTVANDMDELHANIDAVKNNPSLTDPSKAGPPIHVDPYPKSAGMHGGHGHAGMGMK